MANISTWSTAAASNNASAPDGAPEGWFAADCNNWARETMGAVRRFYNDAQWIDHGHTLSYVSATTFKVAGNHTDIYDPARRIRASDASTLYGEVTTRTWASPDTVVTVVLDSGNLTSSLTSLAVGIISGTNNASPNLTTGAQTLSALVVASTATISGQASVGNLLNKGTLTQSGAIVASAAMTLAGAAAFGSTATISGAAVLKTGLTVEGTTTLSGAVALTTTLAVTGAAALGSTATISGAAVLKGALSVGGAMTIAGAITSAATISAAAANITNKITGGSGSLSATLAAASLRIADARLTSVLDVAGAVSLASTLRVTGVLAGSGAASVSGHAVVGSLNVLGIASVSGAAVLKSTLAIAGSVDHSATYAQSGADPTMFLTEATERNARIRMSTDQFQISLENSAGSGTYVAIFEHLAETDGRTRIRSQDGGFVQVDTEGVGLKNLYQPLAEVTLTSWTSGAAQAAAHTLARVPYHMDLVLRCLSATAGFAVGSELPLRADGGHSGSTGLQSYADASLVGLAVLASGLQVANRTSVATMVPSTGAFNIVFKLW